MNAAPQASRRTSEELVATYGPRAQAALVGSILPFWQRALDEVHGGVFNCWDNSGARLVSRDKFTWSQGRFVWLWSRLGALAGHGLLPSASERESGGGSSEENAGNFLEHAAKTVRFLQAHAFLPNGRCAFLLSETGEVKEAFTGAGPAPSIYADCFVVMGFAEFARVSGKRAVLDAAWRLFDSVERRIAAGGFPTHPEPTPEGYDSHAIVMILLNVALVMRDACAGLADTRLEVADARCLAGAERIFGEFVLPNGRVAEMRARSRGAAAEETLLARHLNPGHALEGLWMLLTVAQHFGREDWLQRARQAVQFSLERGWDGEHGGILHFVDRAGGPPAGVAGGSIYENGVRATWDAKLWWVHTEALYATALCHRLTGDEAARVWFERVWEYAFRVFPQPDSAIGEWIQIRDRRGAPLERVVALPVKDPYHIARNLIQLVELFSETPRKPLP